MKKSIKVTCDTKLLLPLTELHEIQGDLKEMTKERFEKFRRLVIKKGLWFSLHVWKEVTKSKGKSVIKWWVIDGHGRVKMLRKLRDEEDFEIPNVPCVEIFAASMREAKEAVLAASSSFQRATGQGLYEFMADAGFSLDDLGDFDLPDIDLKEFEEEFFQESSISPNKGATELDQNSFKEFSYQCPRCGFYFNEGGKNEDASNA